MKEYTKLVIVFGILLLVLVFGLAAKLQQAHITSIQKVVTEQVERGQHD